MEKQHRNIPIAPSSTLPSANIHHYNMRIKTETLKRTQYYWMSYWSEGNLSHPKWDYEGQGCLVMKREEEEKNPEGVGWDACNPSMRQEDCEFDSSLGYIETLCQKQTKKKYHRIRYEAIIEAAATANCSTLLNVIKALTKIIWPSRHHHTLFTSRAETSTDCLPIPKLPIIGIVLPV